MKRFALAAALTAAAAGAQAAAVLTATLDAAPSYISVGQAGVVTVDITNTGNVAARYVSPSAFLSTGCPVTSTVALTDPALVAWVSGPTGTASSCTAYLAPGAHAFFTWVYTGVAPGSETFTVTVTGEEDSGFATLLTAQASDALQIAYPAALSATIMTFPSLAGTYQTGMTVSLYVTNVGQGPADDVRALDLAIAGPAGLAYQGCPPLWPYGPDCLNTTRTLNPGETVSFAWQYLVTAPGTVTITGSATARDHYGGTTVTSAFSATVFSIPVPAVLSLTVTGDSELVQGQQVRLKIVETNVGATAVCQTAFTLDLGGAASGIVSVTPELRDLQDVFPNICFAPGQTREFTLLVTLAEDAPLGPASLHVRGVARETFTQTPALSVGAPLAVTLYSRRPGVSAIVPNPFRPAQSAAVHITYVVAPNQAGLPVTLKVYSLSGELIRTLVDEALPAGVYDAVWDGTNRGRDPVASGVVLVLYQGLGKKDVRKLAVIK